MLAAGEIVNLHRVVRVGTSGDDELLMFPLIKLLLFLFFTSLVFDGGVGVGDIA